MQNFALENIGMMKKNYAFSYNVVDSATGDDFSHSQVHTAQKTKGEYRVKLPDGRVQIVKYTADKNGYKADVRYEEGGSAKTLHEESNGHPNKIPMTATVQLQLLPSNSIHRAYYQDARRTDTGSSFTTAHPSVSRPTHVPAYHPVQLHGLGAHKGRQDEQLFNWTTYRHFYYQQLFEATKYESLIIIKIRRNEQSFNDIADHDFCYNEKNPSSRNTIGGLITHKQKGGRSFGCRDVHFQC
ncbi:unnamed protein product [Acanthoscelides obtectus]|uniref:Uncharacterized protein n=1 Tax=Acanthoscelides obtectus TaxID=200917 RepID=A0A9P0LT93_ACAOB|nr:unnamed protein product [Acanthoscelides obtectus]CAK1652419.1 Pro-resilin [Acanthoscelides obtectus]